VNAGNNGSILGVAAGVWAVQTTAQLGFGTAAFVGTGLAAGQVPLNSNLGTAAYVNTGASAAHHRYQLFFQLTRITRDKGALAKDDRLDALAMAVAYWAKALSVEIRLCLKTIAAATPEIWAGDEARRRSDSGRTKGSHPRYTADGSPR